MHGKVNDALATVGQPIAHLFSEDMPRRGLGGGVADSRPHLLGTAPPWRIPKRAIQNLIFCIPAPLERQVVGFTQVAVQVHDAGKNARLIEYGAEYGGGGNVAIDLEHGIVAEQLHPAINNDLAAILADMTQLARPVTLIAQVRMQFGKFDRKFCLQQAVAAAADRLARRKAVKLLGASIPELDRSVQSPRKHRLLRQCQKTTQPPRGLGM